MQKDTEETKKNNIQSIENKNPTEQEKTNLQIDQLEKRILNIEKAFQEQEEAFTLLFETVKPLLKISGIVEEVMQEQESFSMLSIPSIIKKIQEKSKEEDNQQKMIGNA